MEQLEAWKLKTLAKINAHKWTKRVLQNQINREYEQIKFIDEEIAKEEGN